MPMPPCPTGVEIAAMVSSINILVVYRDKGTGARFFKTGQWSIIYDLIRFFVDEVLLDDTEDIVDEPVEDQP